MRPLLKWPTNQYLISRRRFLQLAVGSLAASGMVACDRLPQPTGTVRSAPVADKAITQVELIPNLPEPFHMRDWRAVAYGYDKLVFDFEAQGDYLPVIWWDQTHTNIAQDTFGLPAYVGDTRQSGGNAHEAINTIAAVLGASLCGIDKSRQNGYDWVAMQADYFNSANGLNLVLDTPASKTGRTFWYEIYPSVLFTALANRYPEQPGFADIVQTVANRWFEACVAMGGSDTALPNFLYTAFDFETMTPKFNGQWQEPDGAAGVAWIEYMAWTRSQDPKQLQAAEWCLAFLQGMDINPLYEVLLPFGAYLAVRLNAELGRTYDAQKLINWCFDGGSRIRYDWGVNARRWGDYDTHGLAALRTQASGYAFAMNTFAWAGALTPIARYDVGYARAIGKWLLNLANSARLFYADGLPSENQSSAFWQGDPEHVIAYEGLQEIGDNGQQPYAAGDPIKMRWGKTDFGLYGSSHVGLLGAIVAPTTDDRIFQLDLLVTDFYHAAAYPTYLYYNPYVEPRSVTLPSGAAGQDIYDLGRHQFIVRGAANSAEVRLPPDSGTVLVFVPPGGATAHTNRQFSVNQVVIDYDYAVTR